LRFPQLPLVPFATAFAAAVIRADAPEGAPAEL